MINSLEVGYEALLKFFPLLSCIFNKKETRRSLYLLLRSHETPRAGFEPATNRLTVDRSTAELPRIGTRRP